MSRGGVVRGRRGGGRHRARGGWAWALALTLAGAGGAGCASGEAAPVGAAKKFANAVYYRDVQTVLGMLESSTRERVEQAADVASDQVGGRRQVPTHEMFQIVGWDRRFKVASAELVEGGESSARVRLTGPAGQVAFVELVHEDDWRVRIPTPESIEAQSADG